MISFRFHLASLVAVFLALSIGMTVGATLLEDPLINRLNDRVDTVSDNLDARAKENRELAGRVDELDRYAEESTPFAVTGRLQGAEVVVAAERGVNEDVVLDTVRLLQQAGGTSPGVLWLEDRWLLEDEEDVTGLVEAVGVEAGEPGAMRVEAFGLVVGELTGPAREGGRQEGGGQEGADPFSALIEAGFLTYEEVGGEGGAGAAGLRGLAADMVLVSGDGSELRAEAVLDLGRALAEGEVPTLVAEVFRRRADEPGRGALAQRVGGVDELAEGVATVDDLELFQGRVATVLGVAALDAGVVGHYGYGPRAERVLPEWTEP